MGIPVQSLPTIGQPNSTEDSKIRSCLSEMQTILTANITVSNLGSEAWTSYAPTWTNVTHGSGGTNIGRSIKLGRTVIVQGLLKLGTGGSVSGEVTVSLPYTSAAYNQIGAARAYDQTNATHHAGWMQISSGTPTVCNPYFMGQLSVTDATPDPVLVVTPPGLMGVDEPFASWGLDDNIIWSISYEAAT